MERLRIIFMGTAELACPSLAALADSDSCQVVAAVTQPDRAKGRDLKIQPSPVKLEAQERNLPVFQPERARNEEFVRLLAGWEPDLIVVAAYGQILPRSILDLPRLGCVNVHTSLLPKYRGAAPIQWAILNDEKETGVTIMKMDAGLDTGDILAQRITPIQIQDNAQTLHDRLAKMGAGLLIETIPAYADGQIQPRPQPPAGALYARKITKEDGRLNWREPARMVWNKIRAFVPWPGAFTFLPETFQRQLLKVWEAELIEGAEGNPGLILAAGRAGVIVACGSGAVRLVTLQREGGKRLPAAVFLTGCALQAGQRFADTPDALV